MKHRGLFGSTVDAMEFSSLDLRDLRLIICEDHKKEVGYLTMGSIAHESVISYDRNVMQL